MNGVYVVNNTKATYLRDVELQNLTSQNVFTQTETDGRYAFKTAVYTKTECDARYAQIGAGGDDNESAYTRNESDFLFARKVDVYDKTQIDGMHNRRTRCIKRRKYPQPRRWNRYSPTRRDLTPYS